MTYHEQLAHVDSLLASLCSDWCWAEMLGWYV